MALIIRGGGHRRRIHGASNLPVGYAPVTVHWDRVSGESGTAVETAKQSGEPDERATRGRRIRPVLVTLLPSHADS
jgi:hypothetical protein